jgi:hypothetical protein
MHYLGKSLNDKIQSDADKVLETMFYDGKSRNFVFETYCSKMNQAFTDIEKCGDEQQESRKVRIFLKGIRAPELMIAKSQILATAHLQATVAEAMNFIKVYKNQLESQKPASRNVSSFETGGRGRGGGRGGGRGRSGGRGRGSGKGRGDAKGKSAYDPKKNHYTTPAWKSLTSEEQQKFRDSRTSKARSVSATKVTFQDADEEEAQQHKRQKTVPALLSPNDVSQVLETFSKTGL